MDPAGLPALLEAIRHLHGCEATFVESAPVTEKMTIEEANYTRTIWEGEVQVFDLIGHPHAKRAYAWSYETTHGKRRFFVVLGLGPVVDAATAVRASIVADT